MHEIETDTHTIPKNRKIDNVTVRVRAPSDLEGNVVYDGGGALHHLIIAAPSAAG